MVKLDATSSPIFMENNQIINNIEYTIPTFEDPIGSISFKVKVPVIYNDKQKILTENEAADVLLSKETLEFAEKLSELIIKDLEKQQ